MKNAKNQKDKMDKLDRMDCKAMATALPDVLFDPGAAPSAAQAHLNGCAACRAELQSMQRTMTVLDEWELPEPSPYWMARMGARLREEQAQPARGWAGFVSRLRTRVWLSNHTLRPATGAAAALGLVLAVGGGTWLDLANQPAPPPAQASNTVRDLQSLNENAQVFQQLSALDSPDSGTQGND